MTRKERETAVEQLEKLRQKSLDVTWMPTDTSYRDSFALGAAIKALEQEPRWIPCSERLPNLNGFPSSRLWQMKVLITGYLSFDDKKELFISEAFASDVIYNRVPNTVITAWMPLPKPYETESVEEE